MGEIRRNMAIIAAGAAFLAGGAEIGYHAPVDNPYTDGSPVEQYHDCAKTLKVTPPHALLPADCIDLVVYKQPEQHHGRVYPANYAQAAGQFAVDKSGYAVAKAEVAVIPRLNGLIGMGFGGIAWWLGTICYLTDEKDSARSGRSAEE